MKNTSLFWEIKWKILGCLKWKLKKNTRLDLVIEIRWVSQRTCSYIHMYINAVANIVMLQLHLGHDFHNVLCSCKGQILWNVLTLLFLWSILRASFNVIEVCHFSELIIWVSLYVFYVHFLCFYCAITTEFW